MNTDYSIRKRSLFDSFSINTILIFLNVIFFIAVTAVVSFKPDIFNYLSLKPSLVIRGKYLWTFLTSMFVHAGFAHLFFNMFSLFFIGSFVERLIGRKRYIWFYIISGLFAGIFFALLSGFFGTSDFGGRIFGDPSIAGVGASGAIFALVGLLAVLIPYSRVYLIIGPLIAIILDSVVSFIFPTSSFLPSLSFILNIYLLISIFAIFSFNSGFRKLAIPVEMPFWLLPIVAILPLVVIGFFVSLPIGNMAHLGGLIAGLVYGFYLKGRYRNKTKLLRRYFG